MTKAQFAILIDSYADAKVSGNKYLMKKMIEELQDALNEVFGSGDPIDEQTAPELELEEE